MTANIVDILRGCQGPHRNRVPPIPNSGPGDKVRPRVTCGFPWTKILFCGSMATKRKQLEISRLGIPGSNQDSLGRKPKSTNCLLPPDSSRPKNQARTTYRGQRVLRICSKLAPGGCVRECLSKELRNVRFSGWFKQRATTRKRHILWGHNPYLDRLNSSAQMEGSRFQS